MNMDSTDDVVATTLPTAVLDVLNAAFAEFNSGLDWLLVLHLKQDQELGSEAAYAAGVTHGVSAAMGLPVDVVAAQAHLGDDSPVLRRPLASERERQIAVAHAEGVRAPTRRFSVYAGEDDEAWWRQRDAYRAFVSASRAAGIPVERLLPAAEADMKSLIADGSLMDDPDILAAYRRGWIDRTCGVWACTPPSPEALEPVTSPTKPDPTSAQPPGAVAEPTIALLSEPDPAVAPPPTLSRRRIVEIGGRSTRRR
jgi:hypothetical protein